MNLDDIISLASLDGRRTSGAIYALEHVLTGKRLICSTKNLSKRLYDQRNYLKKRQHHNPEVRADLERDGPSAFRFLLLELVERPSDLSVLKRIYVEDARRSGGCYNLGDPPTRALLLDTRPAEQLTLGQMALDPLGDLEAATERLRKLASQTNPAALAAWIKRIRPTRQCGT